jgi:rsbT co-antagonist protein RsbR
MVEGKQEVTRMTVVGRIMASRREEILDGWMERLRVLSAAFSQDAPAQGLSSREADELLRVVTQVFSSWREDGALVESLSTSLEAFSRISMDRARRKLSPADTALLVFSLKEAVLPFLEEELGDRPQELKAEIINLNRGVDRLGIFTFECYMKAREGIIAQQSRTIMELSTPIIKLWDGILLLPLVGVVDTVRAAQVIEGLLQAVFETESSVAILDVTGVPIIDTRVAQHLIKTITAAKMLGASVIVTGISPDTAQTMVKLAIDLGSVKTSGTLRAGVAEAFRLIGRKVI